MDNMTFEQFRLKQMLDELSCSYCGQSWDVNRDIRVVNSKRGYTLPEPNYCSHCWQIKSALETAQ